MEEARTSTQNNSTDSALSIKGRWTPGGRGTETNKFQRRPGECYRCGKRGHWERECRSKPQKEEKSNSDTKEKGKSGESEALIGEKQEIQEADEETWYLESGASANMTFKRTWLVNYVAFEEPKKFKIGDGSYLFVYGVGDILIRTQVSAGRKINICLVYIIFSRSNIGVVRSHDESGIHSHWRQ